MANEGGRGGRRPGGGPLNASKPMKLRIFFLHNNKRHTHMVCTFEPESMQTIHKPVALIPVRHGADHKGKDQSTTVECDPWNPELPPPPSAIYEAADLNVQLKMIFEYEAQNDKILSESRARSIITPERTPKSVLHDFCVISPRLSSILKKDSVRSFLNLFASNLHRLVWGRVITPHAFNFIVRHNALRCAKVALEGKAPKLGGNRALPNYMNSFGSFPLHHAASMFSLDMINLLIDYGASANVRTAGNKVIEGLLPLHVAIEDTSMHKYLEDNLLTDKKHLVHSDMCFDYIYKLIHLLCLPEMKMFLDTIRRLAKDTDNVVDELWKYIEDGKLVHAAILLLAAQQQLRNGETQGVGLTEGKNGKARKLLKQRRHILRSATVLVAIMSEAGEALDGYVQTHSEVPHDEVLRHVSSVLKDHGFSPAGQGIDVGNLKCCPYQGKVSGDDDVYKNYGDMDATETDVKSPDPNAQAKKAVGKEAPRSLDYTMFIPYWRSVLKSRLTVQVWPSFALKEKHRPGARLFHTAANSSPNRSKDQGSLFRNNNIGLLGRVSQLQSNSQSRRAYGAAALALLKMLKRAPKVPLK